MAQTTSADSALPRATFMLNHGLDGSIRISRIWKPMSRHHPSQSVESVIRKTIVRGMFRALCARLSKESCASSFGCGSAALGFCGNPPIRNLRLAALAALLCALRASVTADIAKLDLVTVGDAGYAMHRIPALVATPQGTVLAAWEARKLGRGDWDHVDLYLRRSTDGGLTWEPPRELVGQRDIPTDMQRNPAAVAAGLGRDGVFTLNNPTWIADPASGETHLLYCAEYGRAFIRTTRDAGANFSAPRELTAAFETFRTRDGYPWRVLAIGPGHGARLSTGRLVAAVWLSTGEGGHAHRPSVCATIYSDDRGVTWHAGAIVARDPDPLPNPSETAVVEAAPGRVLLAIRSESPRNRRAFATGPDGATGWTTPAFDDTLEEPVCMAGLTRLDPPTPGTPAVLLFSNPASLERNPRAALTSASRVRQNLTLRASRDGGRTWPTRLVLEPGPSAYSDLATLPDGTILCFYERGEKGPYEKLTLARIPYSALLTPSP